MIIPIAPSPWDGLPAHVPAADAHHVGGHVHVAGERFPASSIVVTAAGPRATGCAVATSLEHVGLAYLAACARAAQMAERELAWREVS